MNANLPSKRTLAQQSKSEAVAASFGHDRYDGLHEIAKRECAKTASVASYPKNFIEFNTVAGETVSAHQMRTVKGLDLDAMRRQLSNGLPYGELTDPEMGSVTEYDSSFKLDTPYARAIKAQAA